MKLYISWIIVWAVVVVESSWGLTLLLKRSKILVKGIESVYLSMIAVFSIAQSSMVWISTVAASAQIDDDVQNGGILLTIAFFVVQIVITSALLTALSAVVIFIFVAIVMKLYLSWIIVWAVVVVESSWGLTLLLERSKILVKGIESVYLSMIAVFSIAQSSMVWISTVAASAQIDDDVQNGGILLTIAFFVVQIVITSALLTGLMLYNLSCSRRACLGDS
ncbi:hypothetical protein Bca4012_058797 [Brassica carinata]